MDNFRYELAAAGAELLLEFDLAEESELDELAAFELDESEDEDDEESEDDDEEVDSPFLADPLVELLLAAALEASRLSLR